MTADEYDPEIGIMGRERWPRIREGEREPILPLVRRAVGLRDNYTCRYCHSGFETAILELDHIVPWSAGGSDHSDNLRILCRMCNQERSNRRDGTEGRPMLPVTWWCVECWTDEVLTRTTTDPWLEIQRLVDPDGDTRAYCATCRHVSWTDLTVDDPDARLDAIAQHRNQSPGWPSPVATYGDHKYLPRELHRPRGPEPTKETT